MKLKTEAFKDGDMIPAKYAFCYLNESKEVGMSENINPAFTWEGVPEGTKSLAFICVDSKVPSVGDKVNKEGMTVPKDLPRVDFYHWLLIDLPADGKGIAEGEFSKGITAKGKDDKIASQGTRQGINDYTNWFAGDADMEGDYYGYDGCCPPWNDELIHEYHFQLYALDVEKLDLPERFTGADMMKALDGHILAKDEITGKYSLNKNLV